MGFGGSLVGIVTGKAGADQARYAADSAADQLRNSQGYATAQLAPWSTYGKQALAPLSSLLYGKTYDPASGKFTGDVSQADRFNAFQQSPGYQYQLDQGLKAVQRQNAATGTLLGGNTLKELQEYGSNLANQDYYNYINSLMAQANIGQQADTGIANSYLNTGTQIAGYNYVGGMAKANQYNNLTNLLYSIAGAGAGAAMSGGGQNSKGTATGSPGGGTYNSSFLTQAGMSQMAPQMALAMSDLSLKENLELVGRENGLNIYHFNYKGDPTRYEGVIAQEIVESHPEAVFEKDGFLGVDYNKIGIEFKKI